jgi:hypothetical protein
MASSLPLQLNEDTIPVLLARMGTPLKGDGQLHLMAGMAFRVGDVLSEASVTAIVPAVVATPAKNGIPAQNFTASEAALLVAELHNRGATVESKGKSKR